MYRWLLFMHIASVAFWLGSMAAVFILQRKTKHSSESAAIALAQETARSVVRGVINPSSLVVLISGVMMIMQMGLGGNKPLWLTVMEMGGGTLALVSIALLTWQMRKVTRAASENDLKVNLQRLTHSMGGIGLGVLAIIMVVALRIS